MFVDSHCHLDRLDLAPYNGQVELAINAAIQAKVTQFLCVGIDLENFSRVMEIAESSSHVVASVGAHPLYQESREPSIEDLVVRANHPKVVAIGETGLDYYYCKGDLSWQRERFVTHINASLLCKKPLIIHTREAKEDTLEILRQYKADQVGGVLHCFTEDYDMAAQALDMGFYISFSGIVTFRNAVDLRKVAKKVPSDRLLIETDSPYLAPVPHRGKSNEPKYVSSVAKSLAELRGVSLEKLAETTTENFYRLFAVEKSL